MLCQCLVAVWIKQADITFVTNWHLTILIGDPVRICGCRGLSVLSSGTGSCVYSRSAACVRQHRCMGCVEDNDTFEVVFVLGGSGKYSE